MRKIPAALTLMLTVLLFITPLFSQQESSDWATVYFNGEKFNAQAYMCNGSAYLPMEVMAHALGAVVDLDTETDRIFFNGTPLSGRCLDVDGTIYISVASLAKYLKAKYSFDGKHRVIRITKAGLAVKNVVVTSRINPPQTVSYVTPTRTSVYTPSPVDTPSPTAAVTPTRTMTPVPTRTVFPTETPSVDVTPTMTHAPIYTPTPTPTWTPTRTMTPTPTYMPTHAPTVEAPFTPKIGENDIFNVTVTNLESVYSIKDFYKPGSGNKFVVVYLSQQNKSDEVQIYPGKFKLIDNGNKAYEYLEGLSNFWLVILRPGGINFGYLVFEVPNDGKPAKIVLDTYARSPLSIDLISP
jgi:hypothetical protein